jgi:hypothetical protein
MEDSRRYQSCKKKKQIQKMNVKMNLIGLTDNGLIGMIGNVEDKDWSKDGQVNKCGLVSFVIIWCCKRDFRGFLTLVDCCCIGIWLSIDGMVTLVWTSDMDLIASTASSNAFIDNLTSVAIGSIIGGVRSKYLRNNAWIRSLLSEGEEGRSLNETDGTLKNNFVRKKD